MAGICAGCLQEITDRRFLKCSICFQNYDLECANVSEQRFYNTFTEEHKNTWKCQFCRSKEPKTNNKNTPIRPHHHPENYCIPSNRQSPTADQNVTKRKKISGYSDKKSTISDDDLTISPLGNTLMYESPKCPTGKDHIISPGKEDEQITLQSLTYILQKNNQYIISAIQSTFRNEIENAISKMKTDFKQNFETITVEQSKLQEELSNLNYKITKLDEKCRTIQAENENLLIKIQHLQSKVHLPPNASKDRVLILHGLAEHYWETEGDVIKRIVTIFYDLLNIDLSSYIEEATFIGRNNNRRPLRIELISRRMKKYILENSNYIKEAGFSVTEYLSPEALQEKRNLNRALHIARQNGHHAVLRNNKLIINGKEVTNQSLNDETTNSRARIQNNNDTKLIEQPSMNHQPPRPTLSYSNQSTNTNHNVTSKGLGSRKVNTTRISNFRKQF